MKSWLREEPTAERVLARLQALNVRYLVVTPGYGGGTKVSLYPLATSRPAALRVIELRKRLDPLCRPRGSPARFPSISGSFG